MARVERVAGVERVARVERVMPGPGLPTLPFSSFGTQSNTDSESTKSAVFRIGTNQTRAKFLLHI